MSIVGGVFSETQLKNIQIKADEIFPDRIQNEDYNADVGAAQALLSKQRARINQLEGKKDRTVEIGWINACDVTDGSCSNCTFDGNELSTNIDTYTLDIERCAEFKINEGDFKDNMFDYEEVLAKAMIKADRALSEYATQQFIAFLNTNRGVNEIGTEGAKVVSGAAVGNSDTYITAPYWNANLMGYINRAIIINKFSNAWLLSGKNLFDALWLADKEYGNSDGKGNVAKFGAFETYFDLFNVDSVNDPDLATYIIHGGSYAIANKTYYGDSIQKYMDEYRWSVPSNFLPGLRWDVHYKNSCNSDDDFMTHEFKFKMLSGIFLNPVGCTEERTGILRLLCGEAD